MGFYLPSPEGVASPGVAPDGLKGQYLRKASDLDFDTEWVDVEASTSIAPASSINADNITSGTLAAARLPGSGVTPGTYGSGSAVPVLTLDAAGRVTAASTAAVAGGGGSASQIYAVGKFFQPFKGPLGSGMTNSANTISLVSFTVERSGTVSEIGFRNVTGVGGAVCQVAIYPSANGEPTGVPLGATASLSNSVNTNIAGAFATQFNLLAGVLYWAAVNVSTGSTVNFTSLTTANTYPWNVVGLASLGGSANITGPFNYSIAQAFGTWPDLTGATLTINHGTSRVPAILIKYSAFI